LRAADTVEETLRVEPIRSLRLTDPARVTPGTSLADTIRAMRGKPCGCALVCEGGRAVGIFTERDVLNKILGSEVDYDDPIRSFMTPDPRTLRPQDSIGAALKLMTEQNYRHIPLADEQGREAGMVCAQNIVEFIAEHFPAEVVNLPPRLHQVMRKPEGA
jgi:CBS domain-containing protein